MRRTSLFFAACVCAGILATLGTAWGRVLLGGTRAHPSALIPSSDVVPRWDVIIAQGGRITTIDSSFINTEPNPPAFTDDSATFGFPDWSRPSRVSVQSFIAGSVSRPDAPDHIIELAAGWPALALRATYQPAGLGSYKILLGIPTNGLPFATGLSYPALPVLPLWRGFSIDTLFFGTIFGVVLLVIRAVRNQICCAAPKAIK